MDKRENDYKRFYSENGGAASSALGEYIEDKGGKYMIPYRRVRQVVFAGVSGEELGDQAHAARLQYRLMLMEPVLMAAVDFDSLTIRITYNPEDATNRSEKISLKGLIGFLSSEGVHVDSGKAESKEVDYYTEIYKYYHDPKVLREHPPYGYTLDEWGNGMKAKYEKDMIVAEKKKLDEWRAWQAEFEDEHPELKKAQ
jgi:hypothetical protein